MAEMKSPRSTAARATRPVRVSKPRTSAVTAAVEDAAQPAAPKPRPIATVKRKLSMKLMANPSVSGVGIEHDPEGRAQIKVYLAEDIGHAAWIPRQAGGYPVVTEYIGPIEAFEAE
jgi:hypothetical protein